jgi:ketol-acid reductoisomerase
MMPPKEISVHRLSQALIYGGAIPGLDFTYKIVLVHHIQQTDAYLDIVHAMQCIIHLIYKTNYLYMHSIHDISTGLFEMTVGVLTTCHTQYT